MYRIAHFTLLIFLLAADARAEFPLSRETPRFLPVDEAFQLTADRQGDSVQVRWFVMPGYYLYRKSIAFKAGGQDIEASIPHGEPRHDEYFGDVEVYLEELVVTVPLPEGDELEVRYQGCAEAGYCYPPQKKSLNVPNVQVSGD